MEEEKKIVVSYIVEHYEDGSMQFKNVEREDTKKLTSEEIYRDIEEISKILNYKRIENSCYAGVMRALKVVSDAEKTVEEAAVPDEGPETPAE